MTPLQPTKAILLEPSETLPERVEGERSRPDSPEFVELKHNQSVAEVWPDSELPNPKHLHIVVELPPGERCALCVREISLIVSRLSLTSFLTSTSPRCLADKCLHLSLRPIIRFCFTASVHHTICRVSAAFGLVPTLFPSFVPMVPISLCYSLDSFLCQLY